VKELHPLTSSLGQTLPSHGLNASLQGYISPIFQRSGLQCSGYLFFYPKEASNYCSRQHLFRGLAFSSKTSDLGSTFFKKTLNTYTPVFAEYYPWIGTFHPIIQ